VSGKRTQRRSARRKRRTHQRRANRRQVPPPKPEFFFAPSQLAKRGKEWGRDELNKRIANALEVFVAGSSRWMSIHRTRGAEAVAVLYADLVAGRVPPDVGNIVSFD
jgi:hypothetical protein